MGAAVSSLPGSGVLSASSSQADQKHQLFNEIFTGLFRNTNEIDMEQLADPKLCDKYVFHLHRAIQDMRAAEKANELKFFIIEENSGVYERIGYHPNRRDTKLTDKDMCRQMAIFYLELIFLLYVATLSTSRVFRPSPSLDIRLSTPAKTRRRSQRGGRRFSASNPQPMVGGASPIEDFTKFMEDTYLKPSEEVVANANNYRQVLPRFPSSEEDPDVLFQRPTSERRIVFWSVVKGKGKSQPVKFWADFVGSSADSFDMILYRCGNNKTFDTTTPILKGQAAVIKSLTGRLNFQFTTGLNVLDRVYKISNAISPLTMESIAEVIKIAAQSEPSQLQQNRSFILSQGRDSNKVVTLSAAPETGSMTASGSTTSSFASQASELRQMMVRDRMSLFEIRRNMLTPAGDRLQAWGPNFASDYILKVTRGISEGLSHFSPNPAVMSNHNDLEDWEKLRKENEQRYKNSWNSIPPLNDAKKRELEKARGELEAEHNRYTIALGKIIEGKVIKIDGKSFKINPDFFTTQNNKMSTNAKLNLVVDEVSNLMVRYYLSLERITQKALAQTLVYTGSTTF